MKDFLCGSTEEKRKMHMVNWQTVMQPKDLGGLGLFQTRHRNQAMLAKLCWRLATEHEALWARMLTAKYLSTRRLTEEGRKLPCSRIWAACKVEGPVYIEGLKWTVNNGKSINFWKEFWLPCGPIRKLIEGPLTWVKDQMTVHQYVDPRCKGNEFNFSFELPEQVVGLIKATPFSLNQNSDNSLTWAFSKDGFFFSQIGISASNGLKPFEPGYSLHSVDLKS